MAESYAFKNYINRDAIRTLGKRIQTVMPEFQLDQFVRVGCRNMEPLEFTQRTRHVAESLRKLLPDDVPAALTIITNSLPDELPDVAGMFSEHFWLWPLSDFVRDFATDHWEEAIAACYRLTKCFTAEFAIRPQFERHPEKTLEVLQQWTADESQHVRRLCSEGTRPRLPWASRLQLPRNQVLPILEALNRDPSKFVQKSVANHLNDLGKDDPAWLLKTMKAWNRADDLTTNWIVRHSLRSLIKAGDATALDIFGYGPAKLKNVTLTVTPAKVVIGDNANAHLQLSPSGKRPQNLLIDWVMHYARPSGRASSKVFKGKEIVLPAAETFEWDKSFAMQHRSIRTLHAGHHRLEVQINGKVVAETSFELHE
jgi:3-methyladenine DNA glycosylase AlkC